MKKNKKKTKNSWFFSKNKKQRKEETEQKESEPILTFWTKTRIKALLMLLIAIIFIFSFFNLAGPAGKVIYQSFYFLIGKAIFTVPLLFIIAALIYLDSRQKGKLLPIFLGILILIFGISGILGTQNLIEKQGGILGYLVGRGFSNLFGILVANIIFGVVVIAGLLVFLQFFWKPKAKEEKAAISQLKITSQPEKEITEPRISLKIKEFKEKLKLPEKKDLKEKETYLFPSLDLLDEDKGSPTSGDIQQNSIIIRKTLENFGIPVEMTEVNIGPTVTQYTFKPAEGVKLSKITTLSNNLALALAAHPIRIEAPIPGRSLVGIEVPNKARSIVRLRNLIANPTFQRSQNPLLFCLGRDVSGAPMYDDLGDMPHLLVAGSTGTGKTIFLNSLILSFLYRNPPEDLKFILIDPKRVEFQIYNNFPHLLCPVIYDAQKTINALQWLTKEMERRFDIFSEAPARDILAYNKIKSGKSWETRLPYIVLIIDELADLMAAKGREIEAGIVRLAQMARATGIHLVVATQRPSVEVITGLIKANITSRITFQVASQVDSRTVLDMAGAEKLLGLGDMLFISSRTVRVRRVQSAYVSDREVKKIVNFITKEKTPEKASSFLSQSLRDYLQSSQEQQIETFFDTGEDPLYEEAKRQVLEAGKASASLLQRRLRIGYARAARLIDILEKKGVVGPGEGAKPREVYGYREKENNEIENQETNDEESGWKKV